MGSIKFYQELREAVLQQSKGTLKVLSNNGYMEKFNSVAAVSSGGKEMIDVLMQPLVASHEIGARLGMLWLQWAEASMDEISRDDSLSQQEKTERMNSKINEWVDFLKDVETGMSIFADRGGIKLP